MNAHHAVSDEAHTRIVKIVIRLNGPSKSPEIFGGLSRFAARAACHSCDSGTDRRIHTTTNAGTIPAKNTNRYGSPAIELVTAHTSSTPMFTPVCKIAANHGRSRAGQVSDNNDDPTAHSPPIPSAATNRKIINCH